MTTTVQAPNGANGHRPQLQVTVPELKTRKPTGLPPWPMILVAGGEKSGKSYCCAEFSASELIDRTFWFEIGEGAADMYGALPGARFEIVEHDGRFKSIANAVWAATKQPTPNGKPHAIVIDSATLIWDLVADEQQGISNRRRAAKAAKFNRAVTTDEDAPITMDQWNVAKKRWNQLIDLLRGHPGPVILTARMEKVTVVGADGKPTTDKEWKVRAEKNLGFDVDALIEIPRPRDFYLNGVRTLVMDVPIGAHVPYPTFTVEQLLVDLGIAGGATGPRHYQQLNPSAYADEVTLPEHEDLREDVEQGTRPVTRTRVREPQTDQWSTAQPATHNGRRVDIRGMLNQLANMGEQVGITKDAISGRFTELFGKPIIHATVAELDQLHQALADKLAAAERNFEAPIGVPADAPAASLADVAPAAGVAEAFDQHRRGLHSDAGPDDEPDNEGGH